ncbi:hypothetical protein [Streptomyces microflavus]|uniref:hypothetical protein n=1 Tax=Streptomyces microflavus TaxID=1919 RepID=UPI003825890D
MGDPLSGEHRKEVTEQRKGGEVMTEAETVKLPAPAVRCEYLTPGGTDLRGALGEKTRPAFVVLDLANGTLRAHVAEGAKPPVLVGVMFFLRWPIAPVTNDRANALLDEIAPRAAALVNRVDTHAPGGVLFPPGAGSAVDRIQMACAATWDDPARLVKD